jgi:hypothetical protein
MATGPLGNHIRSTGVYGCMAGDFRMGFCVSVGLLTLLLCPSIFAQDGLQLFHQMQKALGGSEQIAAIRDFEERVHARTWNNEGKPNGEEHKRTRWIRPNYLRLDQVGHDNNTYSLYFDGTSGWEILPDKSVLKLVGDELKFAQGYLSGIDLKIWLADRDPRYRISSPAPNVIRISDKKDLQNAQDLTLDSVSSLPVKQTHAPLKGASGRGQTETHFEQWKMVQGIQFPHRISMIKSGTPIAVITVDHIKLDSGLKPNDLATKPTDLNPDLGGQ